MATKILITPKNSIWGVIVNPQSSNTYRHVLDFASPETKEAFINKELFSGGDYKLALAAQPEQSFTRLTATSAEFVVDPSDYPNETFLSLLNKDFCIIEEDGVEEFYTLSGKRNGSGNTIIYTAELDIFFTYDIKTMFNNEKTRLERGMLDRYVKGFTNDNEPIYNILSKEGRSPAGLPQDLNFDNPFYNTEPDIDNIISSDMLLPEKREIIYPSVEHLCPIHSEAPIINEVLNSLVWNSYFTTLDEKGQIPVSNHNLITANGRSDVKPKRISGSDYNSSLPFSFHGCVIDCSGKATIYDETLQDYILYEVKFFVNNIEYIPSPALKNMLSDAAVLKSSYTPLPYHPFTNIKDLTTNELSFSLIDGGTKTKFLHISFNDGYNDLLPEKKPFGAFSVDTVEGIKQFYLTLMNNTLANIPNKELEMEIFPSINRKSEISPSNEWFPDLETKLLLSPYRKFLTKGSSKLSFELSPQFFSKTGNINIKQSHGFLPEVYSNWIKFENYSNINNPFLFNELDKSTFVELTNYSLPAETSIWNDYISQNRSQLNTNMGISGAGIGLGILGTLAAPFTGGASLLVTGASIGGLVSSTKAIATQAAQIKDLQNSPDKFNGIGSTFMLDSSYKSLTPYLYEMKLDPRLKYLIAQHFFKYGYNLAEQLFDINKFLHNRRTFNYIKANETFENIILQASAEIKQLINDTISEGVTIWHVYPNYVFKGIKNYKYQNIEQSLGLG